MNAKGFFMNIPFYARYQAPLEEAQLRGCLHGSLATDGPFAQKAFDALSRLYPGRAGRAVLTASCSLALETALQLCGLAPGDEVLMPSYNFPSAANAVLRAGGVPVFCDIDPDTQNISIPDAAARITARTKAVIPVHYAGISCRMNRLLALARDAGLCVIEDAAHAIGASYRGAALGALGDFGCVSFHHTKNISCGEGGLLLCKSPEAYKKARCYRVHGTNRDAFLDGACDRYTWVCPGSSTALGEPCAALLFAQLSEVRHITEIRTQRLRDYLEFLRPLEERGAARLMAVPDDVSPNGHIFYLRFESPALRRHMHRLLLENGVDAKTHYVPLHLSPMGAALGYRPKELPETVACHDTLLRLPIHTQLTREQVFQISEIMRKGLCSYG